MQDRHTAQIMVLVSLMKQQIMVSSVNVMITGPTMTVTPDKVLVQCFGIGLHI